MQHLRAVLHALGSFLLILAAAMLVPLFIALQDPNDDVGPVLKALILTALIGSGLMWKFPRFGGAVTIRQGFLLVVLGWLGVCAAGALPFYYSRFFSGFTDAFFESTSGFTTTGASILTMVEVLPDSLQFWRCFTHWLGGMGIVMLGIAILPLLATGGMSLYQAQFSGATSDRIKPRVFDTARALWKVYLTLTLAEYVALRWAGLPPLDALCTSFSTLGTGGFSTRTASIGDYGSPVVETVVIFFMILASINFTQHYSLWVEKRPARFFSVEVRVHMWILGLAILVTAATLAAANGYSAPRAVRSAAFQVTSIQTCTGFVTDDYEKWHPLAQILLLVLMYVGGNTGSTSGGIKTFRIILLFSVIFRQLKRRSHRRGVFAIRIGRQVVPEATVRSLLALVQLVLTFNLAACLLLTASGVDLLTSISAVATTMFGVGPGLGQVGPMDNYSGIPALGKWILCSSMLAGRLEFYTAMIVFTPAFWKR